MCFMGTFDMLLYFTNNSIFCILSLSMRFEIRGGNGKIIVIILSGMCHHILFLICD